MNFTFSPNFVGRLISEQTVGVIGTGRIGQAAIKLFKGLGAKVIAYDKYPLKNTDNSFVYAKKLGTNLSRKAILSQFICRQLMIIIINLTMRCLSKMKDTAILINTARGSIVDTDDLIFALQSGEIVGAGIDTIENESADLQDSRSTKKVNDPDVLKMALMPNVLITPHSAFHTSEAVKNMIDISLGNLETMVNGKTPKDLVD